ncbi:RNA polymerase recycling motor HelD [Gorillibacterium timonense]|uniref:RNA polymerase recycling motor HelD n=1 Tax=Gorillibacterium timonense TaxID=1689269 RepID=UPI00071D373C|nr:RNA polymerase recycling motor HelD [Gorillibacterium timonense]
MSDNQHESVTNADWETETTRIAKVETLLQQEIEHLEPIVGSLREQVVDIRKHFWDGVSIDLGTADDVIETYASMRQQAEVLTEREIGHRNQADRLKKMIRLLPSPYFGRIDFTETGESDSEPFYIGLATFQNEETGAFYVYDWRTPVASLYYDHSPGPASYETPVMTITGTMDMKRQYVIRNGQLEMMFDTGVTIGDELLQQALSRGADSQMKSIVATIQKEQNRIIRNLTSPMLIVQGAAGSGKTSAALQRVAYLLYRHRSYLKADQIILFSPNPMFNSYVASVLPELGEENMLQTTFQEYLDHSLQPEYQVEDPYDQMEYVLGQTDDSTYEARLEGIRFKASEAYLDAIRNHVLQSGRSGLFFHSLEQNGRVYIDASEIRDCFYRLDKSIQVSNRMDLTRQSLLERLKELEKAERSEDWVTDELDYQDRDRYQQAYVQFRKRLKEKDPSFEDSLQEEDILRRMIVKDHFAPLRRSVQQLEFIDLHSLYLELFRDPAKMVGLTNGHALPNAWPEICRITVERLNAKRLPHEDATPLLYLTELVKGFQTNTQIRHVVIDEAQDYSAFQFEFLKRLFPRARMTVLGDFNQAIFTHSTTLSGRTPLLQLFGPDKTETIHLTQSYRSTWEIVEFTRSMLDGNEEIVPFRRYGEKPLVVRLADGNSRRDRIVKDTQALQEQGYETVAILCRTAAESRSAYEELKDALPVRLISKDSQSFSKGLSVIPSYLAKGVEFDAVLIYDASEAAYSSESERKLFYTACTRAMHHLTLYSPGPLNPFLRDADSETFTVEQQR